MARSTDRWGLSILGPGDSLSAQGYKAVDADRRLIDRLLAYATERHQHTGATGEDRTPLAGPTLSLETTGGGMPSSARYFYAYTVIDESGNESAASPSIPIDTPAAVGSPTAPALAYLTGTGSLQPGTYSYAVSAYKATNSLETKAANASAVTIPGTNPSNSISVALPDLPIGATGLNIYRKTPTGLHYLYLHSVVAPTHGATWVDDGTVAGDCDRSLPSLNRTSNTNAVRVTYPGATPYIPDGWSWRIYRTQNPSNWTRSYLTDVVPIGTTPYTPVEYVDVGGGTRVGAPPTVAQVINEPPKIRLQDAAEVTGSLPPGRLTTPTLVTFHQPGPVVLAQGTFTWVCEFDEADIVTCRAYLGSDSQPTSTAVVVDVNASRPGQSLPLWTSIYGDGPNRPTVPVGQSVGESTVPDIRHLVQGDLLSVDVDQTGGGATPTDTDITVNILMYTKYGPEDASYNWTS